MEDVGAQLVAPIVIHPTLAGRFCDSYSMTKKRDLSFHSSSFVHQNTSDNWSPRSWDWDSARFVAKPLQCDGVQVGSGAQIQPGLSSRKEVQDIAPNPSNSDHVGEDENLLLKLGGGFWNGSSGMNLVEPQPLSRPNKRVRSGSPGSSANYPMCQVDNCKEDLPTAKDYHRRHKVCEVHSKASKALVGKQMQRFCQQCSRFHTLSEFDEGKRSCRRRLAGHNRRRRKTQPDDSSARLLVPRSHDNNVSDSDIVNVLAMLTHAQGNAKDRSGNFSAIPDKDQLLQILSKINSLPLPANLAAKLNGSIPNLTSSENQNQKSGTASSPSTMDLLAALSPTPGAPLSGAAKIQSQPSTEESESEKSKSPCVDQVSCLKSHRGPLMGSPLAGGERRTTTFHSPMEEVDFHVQETSPSLHLQLLSSSPEDNSSRQLPLGGNCLSSDSNNPSEERSPVSSPPLVHDLFPMRTSSQIMKADQLLNSEGEISCVKATVSNGCSTSLQLFGNSIQATENGSIQSSPYQAGYLSSTMSDHHSPSSLNSDAQDRTGRIIFKLFDKDPSHLPGSLRTQIYNWLSNSPSEMESFIRPGCIVLSLYLSMPSFVWDQLEENLLNYVKSLIRDMDVNFWLNGRFLVHTDRQMVSHKEGKIRLCKYRRAWKTPALISVSPLAVVGGQETSLLLRGRGLTAPGTKIHCTHAAGYNIKEVPLPSCQETTYDEICLGSFKVNEASGVLGRCFIEVENSFRGTSFPIIIADNTICQELRILEREINGTAEVCDRVPADCIQNPGKPWSREEVLHFLDELGWLFQRKCNSFLFGIPDYRITRFKFLLTFSVEHDFCALVKTLLDILLELNLGRKGLVGESLEMLSEIHLLERAVKRRCRRMVDMLIRFSIIDSTDTSEKFIFVPNMAAPGGITPLHLAACTSSSDDIVDALTSDPLEIGLHSWNSVLDANGLSPYAYALMRNNHSYNALVTRKLADRKNGQVSVSIENEIEQFQVGMDKDKKTSSAPNQGQKSCSRCAVVAARGFSKKFPGSKGLLQRPYIHSMLVIAAVCVCVCVLLRGHPHVGCGTFAWENLGFGAF